LTVDCYTKKIAIVRKITLPDSGVRAADPPPAPSWLVRLRYPSFKGQISLLLAGYATHYFVFQDHTQANNDNSATTT